MKIRENLSPHCDERRPGSVIDTLVIHSMYDGQSGKAEPLECIEALRRHEVSAHYIIDRLGSVWRLVPDEKRAWHAGKSEMPDGRTEVNHFSIGVELLALDNEVFTDSQYEALTNLANDLSARLPLKLVVSHEGIARPVGRKKDPGPLFDWQRLKALFKKKSHAAALQFPQYGA